MFEWTKESAAFLDDAAACTGCYDRLAQAAARRMAPEASVFEGGCGLGHLSESLAGRGFPVTAMDTSPLALEAFAARVRGKALPLNIRLGDAFGIPPEESFDYGLFCFFGSMRDVLTWGRTHSRRGLILFKKNWATHRFTRDPGAIRKFTYPLTCAELRERGVPYETEVFDLDMGQPFRSLPDAVRFFRLYDPASAMTEADILPRLMETADPAFPYYLPAVRPVGMICIRADDLRNIPLS